MSMCPFKVRELWPGQRKWTLLTFTQKTNHKCTYTCKKKQSMLSTLGTWANGSQHFSVATAKHVTFRPTTHCHITTISLCRATLRQTDMVHAFRRSASARLGYRRNTRTRPSSSCSPQPQTRHTAVQTERARVWRDNEGFRRQSETRHT